MNRLVLLPVVLAFLFTSPALGQRRYELFVEGANVASLAERTPDQLTVVDRNGAATQYRRDARFDSDDGAFVAFANEHVQQIIRWPLADEGHMQIASSRTEPPTFRPSRMVIRPIGPAVEELSSPVIASDLAYRLVPLATSSEIGAGAPGGMAMGVLPDDRLVVQTTANEDSQIWQFAPLEGGYYRIHSGAKGRRWSLTAGADAVPRLEPTARDPRQLWQFMPVPSRPGFRALASLAAGPSPLVLTIGPTGSLVLAPFTFAPTQMWMYRRMARPLPPIFAQYRFSSREFRPNPPIPPAQVEFVNNHDKELWVLVTDQRNPSSSMRLKIPPGKSETREIVRESGGTLVEVYESVSAFGAVQREELVTPLPPGVRYDVSVYQLALQSIAIDRTVPGGKVEDVNYSPKSVGWFELPPGPDLTSGPLAVHETARQNKNPGGVRAIDPSTWRPQGTPRDPVEALLEEFQKRNKK